MIKNIMKNLKVNGGSFAMREASAGDIPFMIIGILNLLKLSLIGLISLVNITVTSSLTSDPTARATSLKWNINESPNSVNT